MGKNWNSKQFRLAFVLIGGGFVLFISVFAKLYGDGYLVPIIFLVGWLIFASLVIVFLRNYNWKE